MKTNLVGLFYVFVYDHISVFNQLFACSVEESWWRGIRRPCVTPQADACCLNAEYVMSACIHTRRLFKGILSDSNVGADTTITRVTKHFSSIKFHVSAPFSSLNSHSALTLALPVRTNQPQWASMRDCPLGIIPVNHRVPQPLFSTNHKIPLWSQMILIFQLVCLLLYSWRTRWVGCSHLGAIHLITLCQTSPINHRKVIWSF